MDKFIVYFIVCIAAAQCFCKEPTLVLKSIDVYSGIDLTLPSGDLFSDAEFVTYAEQQNADAKDASGSPWDSTSFRGASSCKIVFTHVTLFGSLSLKDSTLAECKSFDSRITANWGAALSFGQRTTLYSTEILCGNLHFSHAISRLKNPRPSSSSALRRPTALLPGIAPSLPTRSSASTGPALAVRIFPALSQHFLPSIEASYSQSGEWSASISASGRITAPAPTLLLPAECTIAVTTGSFLYQDYNPSAWFSDEARFRGDLFPSTECIISIIAPLFRTTNALGINAAPVVTGKVDGDCEDNCTSWYRTQNALVIGPFCLGSSFFCADSSAVCSSGNHLTTQRQLQVNPQYTFFIHRAPLRVGLLGEITWNPLRSYAIRFDSDFKPTGTLLACNAGYRCSSDKSDGSFNASVRISHRFSGCTPSLSVGFGKGERKTSWSGCLALRNAKQPSCSGMISTAFFMEGNSFCSCAVSASISLSGKVKWFKWQGKMALLTTLK